MMTRTSRAGYEQEASMQNSTRKTIVLVVIVLVTLVALRMFGVLQVGAPVAYAPTVH